MLGPNRTLMLAFAIAASLAQIARPESSTATRPNILFIYTDDQAPWAVGISGYPQAKTPHLDALFADGAYLRNAFTTTPVCSPSRASLLASRYGSELGITDWLKPQAEPLAGLPTETLTWVEILRRAGYRTGLVGKWHLGLTDEFHPTKFGYEYFMGFRGGGTSPANPTLEVDGKNRQFSGLTPDILTDHAIAFLDAPSEKPFCLCLHFRAPHAPWLPVAEDDWSSFQTMDPTIPNPEYPGLDVARVKRMTREYLASVHSVDRNVGRLLAALDELSITDNTIVVFSSDHGYNMGHNGITHKGNGHWALIEPPPATKNIPKGQRPNMYDNSIRVPTAVRWPGVIAPGTIVDRTISNLDWFPTLLSMAKVSAPTDGEQRGRDFLPLLRGEPIEWSDDLYAEYSTKHQSRTHMRMFRTRQWKLVRDFLNPDRDELYDLQDDPAETVNLINSKSARIQQIVSELDDHILANMRAIGDPVGESLERTSAK